MEATKREDLALQDCVDYSEGAIPKKKPRTEGKAQAADTAAAAALPQPFIVPSNRRPSVHKASASAIAGSSSARATSSPPGDRAIVLPCMGDMLLLKYLWICVMFVFGISVYRFFMPVVEPLLLFLLDDYPDASDVQGICLWLRRLLHNTAQSFWLLPLLMLSKLLNFLRYEEISEIVLSFVPGYDRSNFPSRTPIFTDVLYTTLQQTLFIVQANLFVSIALDICAGYLTFTLFAEIYRFVHVWFLCSFHAFEVQWWIHGWSVRRRAEVVEDYWPCYFGFTLPLAALAFCPVLSYPCCFMLSLVCPLCIVGYQVFPAAPERARFPLRLFAPSLAVTDAVFRVFKWAFGPRTPGPAAAPQEQSSSRQDRGSWRSPFSYLPKIIVC